MSEQSQKDEMNAAIRAQRERHNVPRSIAPHSVAPEPRPAVPAARPPEPEQEPARPRGLLTRLLGR